MRFHVVTIFPDIVRAYVGESILKRAVAAGTISVDAHDLRAFSEGRHKTVDDAPYGGGAGMVMKPDPFFRLVEARWPNPSHRRIILLSPQGRPFVQETARALAAEKRDVVLLCGRYEAIDERVREALADEEISVGDYVLTGGELPALVIIDAVARLIPGVLGDSRSAEDESFTCGLLDYPHYTRPEDFRGMRVPPVLLSGNHREIERWRRGQSLRLTLDKRPDLLPRAALSDDDRKLLDAIKEERK